MFITIKITEANPENSCYIKGISNEINRPRPGKIAISTRFSITDNQLKPMLDVSDVSQSVIIIIWNAHKYGLWMPMVLPVSNASTPYSPYITRAISCLRW